MFMVTEDPLEYIIEVNGTQIEYIDIGWWKDTSFKKIDILNLVKLGVNDIVMKRKFYQSDDVYRIKTEKDIHEVESNKLGYSMELESIYVIGDFGVFSKDEYTYGENNAVFTKGPFVIDNLPSAIQKGDITTQGFCFFSGCMTLSKKFTSKLGEMVRFKMDRPLVAVSKLYVNDQYVKTFAWAPFEVDISNYIKDGENKASIEIMTGNRNLMGPHHHYLGEFHNVGPASFTDRAGWSDKKPIGESIWRDNGYCFTRVGL